MPKTSIFQENTPAIKSVAFRDADGNEIAGEDADFFSSPILEIQRTIDNSIMTSTRDSAIKSAFLTRYDNVHSIHSNALFKNFAFVDCGARIPSAGTKRVKILKLPEGARLIQYMITDDSPVPYVMNYLGFSAEIDDFYDLWVVNGSGRYIDAVSFRLSLSYVVIGEEG